MKKKPFYKYLFASTVGLLVLLIAIILLIGHFVIGWDVSKYLIILISYTAFNLIEKARFFKKVDETVNDPIERIEIGLKISKSGRF